MADVLAAQYSQSVEYIFWVHSVLVFCICLVNNWSVDCPECFSQAKSRVSFKDTENNVYSLYDSFYYKVV